MGSLRELQDFADASADRLANTELSLDKAKSYNSRAADGAKEIRRLNQSIFKWVPPARSVDSG